MLNFKKFHEYALLGDDTDNDILTVIRKGIEIGDESFWDQFLRLSSAMPDKLGKLLNVRTDVIKNWNVKIKSALDQVSKIDNGEAAFKKPKLMRGKGNAELSNPTGGGINSPDAISNRDTQNSNPAMMGSFF